MSEATSREGAGFFNSLLADTMLADCARLRADGLADHAVAARIANAVLDAVRHDRSTEDGAALAEAVERAAWEVLGYLDQLAAFGRELAALDEPPAPPDLSRFAYLIRPSDN